MLVDLVRVHTRDGVRLDGCLRRLSAESQLSVDAVCLVHGTGGCFYSSSLFDALADRLVKLGCAVLVINTRGHDLMSTAVTERGGRRLGAAYEVVDDCRHDLVAWIDWLRAEVGPRVGLVGHSLGAVKSLYTMAHEPGLDVQRVVAISPPRLSYSWFCSNPESEEFLRTYQEAERLAEAGRPETLMEVRLPMPFVVTAGGYLEKYGPQERYNYLSFLRSVKCPVLLTFGSIEMANNMAFRAVEEPIAQANRHGLFDTAIVEGADHFYSGLRDALIERVAPWLREVS